MLGAYPSGDACRGGGHVVGLMGLVRDNYRGAHATTMGEGGQAMGRASARFGVSIGTRHPCYFGGHTSREASRGRVGGLYGARSMDGQLILFTFGNLYVFFRVVLLGLLGFDVGLLCVDRVDRVKVDIYGSFSWGVFYGGSIMIFFGFLGFGLYYTFVRGLKEVFGLYGSSRRAGYYCR